MAVFLMVSLRLRETKLVRDRTVPSPEMFPALRGCERASKCIPAPRGMWLPRPVRSRCLRITINLENGGS